MAQLQAYLMFKNNANEAMTFYQSVFGGKLDVMLVKDSPSPMEGVGPDMENAVMHAYLESGRIILMASDMVKGGEAIQGNTVSLCLVCESKEEIETFFSKLSEGGEIGNPLKEEFFGTYGDLTDKYGFNWMFQYSPKKES